MRSRGNTHHPHSLLTHVRMLMQQGYAHCDGFQLPTNVHYTPEGWSALAAEMAGFLVNKTTALL
jgi:hypothetical protein